MYIRLRGEASTETSTCTRFEVTAVKMSVLIFWVVKPRGLVGRCKHLGGTYFLYPQPPKLWTLLTSTRNFTIQKTEEIL
jgi:hypothetical protein